MMNENNVNENNVVELNEELLENVTGGKSVEVQCKVSQAEVRTGPGNNYELIGHLYKGEKVTYKGEHHKDTKGRMWVCVKKEKGSKYGWILKDMLG